MENTFIYEKAKTVPDNAKKQIKGGRLSGMTDINPMWRIKILTELFGPCGIGWYYIPAKKWMEIHGDETAAFVDIELYVKVEGEWSKPIYGTGGSSFATKEKNGVYVSDECYKMATTDAISVACKQLGIGADVYWDADRTKYDGKPEDKKNTPPALISPAMQKKFAAECVRIGKSQKAILSYLKVPSLDAMTVDQFTVAMEMFKKTPDKPMTQPGPATIPPDDPECGLPFGTPAR